MKSFLKFWSFKLSKKLNGKTNEAQKQEIFVKKNLRIFQRDILVKIFEKIIELYNYLFNVLMQFWKKNCICHNLIEQYTGIFKMQIYHSCCEMDFHDT